MLPNSLAVVRTFPDRQFASPLAELQAREAEIAGHLPALDTAAHQAAIGEQLLVIRDKQLFQAVGFKSVRAYLAAQRTPMSRARAYQLMNFAKQQRLAAEEGRPLPANERQARAYRAKADPADGFEKRWTSVIRYLRKKFFAWPERERARFAEVLEVVARSFSAQARCGKASIDGKSLNPIDPALSPQGGSHASGALACQTETFGTAPPPTP